MKGPGLHPLPPPGRISWLAVALATWGGSGRLRPGAGTWGSIAALPVGLVLGWAGGWALLLAATVVTAVAGTWASGQLGAALAEVDASQIVVDEVVGQWLALLPVIGLRSPSALAPILAALLLFRAFDIVKPWPARWIDRQLKSALGVMLDDVVAGVYSGGVLGVLLAWGIL